MKIKPEALRVDIVFYISSNDVDVEISHIEEELRVLFSDSFDQVFKGKLTASAFEVVYRIKNFAFDDETLSHRKFFAKLSKLFQRTKAYNPAFTNHVERGA